MFSAFVSSGAAFATAWVFGAGAVAAWFGMATAKAGKVKPLF
jgi:hypothetical protein